MLIIGICGFSVTGTCVSDRRSYLTAKKVGQDDVRAMFISVVPACDACDALKSSLMRVWGDEMK